MPCGTVRHGYPVTNVFTRYWGKADPAVGGFHLAALHCLDVAAVAETMVSESQRLGHRLATWMGVPPPRVAPTIALFVALHDVGKFDSRFQAKAPDAARALSPSWQGLHRAFGEGYDHGAAGYGHLRRDLADVIGAEIGRESWPLLQAVTGHHGELPGRRSAEDAARWGDLRSVPLREADRAARAAWLAYVVSLFRERGAALPVTVEPGSPLVVLLAGLCSVADWIGSSVDFFPYVEDAETLNTYYETRALGQARQALVTLGLRAGRPSGRTFADLFPDCTPRDVQCVTEALDLPTGPALIVVEAQMGSGKTEAALSLAERLLARGDASGLYVALPTMATSNAMYARLERDVPRMFEGLTNVVLAHGKRRMNVGFERVLARSGPSAAPYADEATVVCNRWLLARKRALLGQVGVGTVDQAMLAAVRVRHHFVRAYGLAESVVVLDEVHAYDAYMQVILDRLVEWLGALGAPVILLSATLPADKRRGFVEAYARGAGWTLQLPAPPVAADAPYPLVTTVSSAGVSEQTTAAPPTRRDVTIETVATNNPEDVVLPRLAEAARAGAMVAWIRNTVSDAQRAWDAARALHVPSLVLFHARMRAIDRAIVETRVLCTYGRSGERRGGLLIATQVVEQSLDLDFDLLATDLAPIDLALQRAGRLHRHNRPHRPTDCDTPRLVVVGPETTAAAALDFGGSGYVYDRTTLALTLALLVDRGTVALPIDIRQLIEAVYDPAVRDRRIADAPNAAALTEAEAKGREKLAARQAHARRACIAPATFDPLAAEAYYSDDDETVQALTRDGDSTTLLPVLWDGSAGAALDGGDAWRLDPEAPDAWREARALAEQMVSVPSYPWESIERGVHACGEARDWETWERRARVFCDLTGLGDAVIVPMRSIENATWSGNVETRQGQRRGLSYARDKGLWFTREEPG